MGSNPKEFCYDQARIDTGTYKRYVHRDQDGKFKESVDVSRSLSADARHDGKHDTKSGEGDKGDRKR